MDFNRYYEDRQKLVNTFLEKRLEKRGSHVSTKQWPIACWQEASVFVRSF